MNVLAEGEIANKLPLSPMWIGIVALLVFATLLAVTYAFRGVSHRHAPEAVGSTTGSAGRPGAGSH
ncbi:MAG: hypothetical protein WAL50_07350 [Kineosporiaceae bacterium]|jgi:ABC-type transporter Mla maintaining outer membrane lipid asymmetry permease subunit MlaE